MSSSTEPVIFFRFLKENSGLFTICALFAAFYFYVITLLKDPENQLKAFNSTELREIYLKPDPQIKVILDQIATLQLAAVVSFLIFSIILLSIILISLRYDFFSEIFAFLLGALIFFSFAFLITSFKGALLGFLSIFFTILFFLFYIDLMISLGKEYRKSNFTFDYGFYWYCILDILLIMAIELNQLFWTILTQVPTLELIYLAMFSIYLMMTIIACIGFHFIFLVLPEYPEISQN